MTLTEQERHIMAHATGWHLKNRLYRNHYVAGSEQDVWPVLLHLVERGMMTASPPDPLHAGMATFKVTPAGIAALKHAERHAKKETST